MKQALLALGLSLSVVAPSSSQSLVSVDEIVTSGLERPVQVAAPPDGSARLFVVEQTGRIRVIDGGVLLSEPFLDASGLVTATGERGLLGLAFHPRYAENGLFFVDYTNRSGDTVVARYSVSADPNRADPTSAVQVLGVAQPFANHNGGQILFGPFDGYLYVGMGDGGSGDDPLGHGQNVNTLLGALLRLDVDNSLPYTIPPDNPFVGLAGRDEIWAFGLRNPWRFSFDRETGDLYIGDVGQNRWEEVDFLPDGAPGGANFGWAIREGPCPRGEVLPCAPAPPELTDPIAFYGRTEGRSITGGFVYRGLDHPSLAGRYFYADFITGRLWSVEKTSSAPAAFSPPLLELETGLNVAGFGEDESGELYLVDFGGALRRLTALAPPDVTDPSPGSRLLPGEQTFQWDPRETPADAWRLTAGSTPGEEDYFDSGELPSSARSALVTGLPSGGGDVFVRLGFLARGTWRASDFAYQAAGVEAPAIRWPAPGSAFRGRFAFFLWERAPEQATALRLTAGSVPGGSEYYDSGALGPRRRWAFVTGLPTDGSAVHVRLEVEVAGATLFTDAAYEAATRP